MEIKYDYPPFQKALKAMWPGFNGRSVCSVENGAVLGGCGFSPVVDGVTHGFLLSIADKWASRRLYSEILRFPFSVMGADTAIAGVRGNVRSRNVVVTLGGFEANDGTFVFRRDSALEKAGMFYAQ